MISIALHLNHDSAICVREDTELRNIELERITAVRHYDWKSAGSHFDLIARFVPADLGSATGILIGAPDSLAEDLLHRLGVEPIRYVDHHLAHAAAAFYQSPFEQSLLISYDGGGNDGTFRIFLGRRGAGITPLQDIPLNLGIPYRALAHPTAEIRKPEDGKERTNAGKLMGLGAYGQVRPDWIEPLMAYYRAASAVPMSPGMYLAILDILRSFGPKLGLDFRRDALHGVEGFDLAATGQHVYEKLFLDSVLPLIRQRNLPVCVSGGCALNVITNQRLAAETGLPIFVPPNPSDCGLALGATLHLLPPRDPVCTTYSGVPILDLADLPARVAEWNAVQVSPAQMAERLAKGAVIAVMRGHSEHGPRALGNRSILCDPGVPGMKDRLNGSIKFREAFRPYAPVVRGEDVSRYFDEVGPVDMSFMSFNPSVKPAWRERLRSAVHVDGTARAQTVRRDQNPWLHEMLGQFEQRSGYGVLLNTSFNIKGKPMVTSLSEALAAFNATDLDHLLIENHLFSKVPRARQG